MERRFPIKRAFATGLLLLVAFVSFLSLNRVKTKAYYIVADTLTGLSDAGMANSNVSDDFNHLLMALMASTPGDKAGFCAQADIFEVEAAKYLKAYENSIFENEDRSNFKLLMARRKEYLEARQQVRDLMNRGADKESVAQYKTALLQCYNQYMAAGKVLLDYNTRQGNARGKSIMRLSKFTQYAVAAFTVVLFILGFVVGIFRYNPSSRQPRPAAPKAV